VDAANTEELELLRATTLGEYEILGELGRGGMATVYAAHDIALDRRVAIKVISPSLGASPPLVERFRREARTAASLSHPNIIPIYSVRHADRLLYFVMKHVDGRPLDSILRETGALPVPTVQAILGQVAGAVGYAHRHGVVHRDIKPGNIILDDEGWCVVTDFGIAKVAESEGLTTSGMMVGTPAYMSPEQCLSNDISGATDQYALGVVAYEMLTGRLPFPGTSMMSVMYAHVHVPVPAIEELRAECPPELAGAVMRMLAKEPADRWPSIEEAVAALGHVTASQDEPTRNQLITLATTGSQPLTVRYATPRSPMPFSRSSFGMSEAKTLQIGALKSRKGVMTTVAAVGLLVAAAVYFAPWRRPALKRRRMPPSAPRRHRRLTARLNRPATLARRRPSLPDDRQFGRGEAGAQGGAGHRSGRGDLSGCATGPDCCRSPGRGHIGGGHGGAGRGRRFQARHLGQRRYARTCRRVRGGVGRNPRLDRAGTQGLWPGTHTGRHDAEALRRYPGIPSTRQEQLSGFFATAGRYSVRWKVSGLLVTGNRAQAQLTGSTLKSMAVRSEHPRGQRQVQLDVAPIPEITQIAQ
jgi:serine/threonine protein kinase